MEQIHLVFLLAILVGAIVAMLCAEPSAGEVFPGSARLSLLSVMEPE